MMRRDLNPAFDALRELLDRRDRGEFTDREFFENVARAAPLVSLKVEESTASGASHLVHRYEPSRDLVEFLLAVAARDRDRKNPQKLASNHPVAA